MRKHRNPRQRLSKLPPPDNFDPGILINQLYEDLVEVEAVAVTADEAVTQLPPRPPGKDGKTLARLYTLVTVDVATLEGIFHHAAFAAHLVGHLDDNPPLALIRQLGDRIDEIAHELSELLGEARTLAARDAAAHDVAHDGAPMLASSQLTLDRSTLEKLLHLAVSAAHRVGHLRDAITTGPLVEQVDALGDDLDAIAHELSELLGKARTLAEHDAAAHDGAPMLALDAGGAP